MGGSWKGLKSVATGRDRLSKGKPRPVGVATWRGFPPAYHFAPVRSAPAELNPQTDPRPAALPPPMSHATERRYPTAAAASAALADELAAFLAQRLGEEGTASLVLTGGRSPATLYRLLAERHRGTLDWGRVHFFWGDERDVPAGDEQSNTRATAPLLDHVPADGERLHAWRTDLEHADCLAEMRDVLAEAALPDDCFDVVLLGIGEDGHVASLFPDDRPWLDLQAEAAPDLRHIPDSPKPPPSRYTFTLPRLNRSRRVVLLGFGDGKAGAVAGVLAGDPDLPASHARGLERTELWRDGS